MTSSDTRGDLSLLWLCGARFLVLSIGARLDIDEILTDGFWEMKCAGVLLIEGQQQRAKCARYGISRSRLVLAGVAEPLVGETSLDHGRINTLEVE